jgi:hypothetical protein
MEFIGIDVHKRESQVCVLGEGARWCWSSAHRLSDERRQLRAQVAAREVLVRTRTRLINQVSAQVRHEGPAAGGAEEGE